MPEGWFQVNRFFVLYLFFFHDLFSLTIFLLDTPKPLP